MTLLAEQYSVTEAIIWYSILVVTIIIFILYLKFYGHAKKGYNKLQAKLGREITRLEMMQKALKDKKPHDNLKKTAFVLASVTIALQDIGEKTTLTDVNDALKLIDKITNQIKKLDLSENSVYVKALNEIIVNLNRLNSMIITIIQIIK